MTPQEVLKHSDTGDLWPTSGDCECNELSSAYETALAVRALRVARGELPGGYKIGFTNRTIWSRYNVFAPIWGSMWNTTIAHCNGAGAVSLARLCQPRIEPEVVFGIKATPRANSSLEELFEALEWAAPGFEIVQSHAPNWVFTAPQTVVDGGLHGRLLIGQRVPIADLACDAEQLHQVLAGARVRLQKNGELMEEGAGVNVLDSPLRALMHFLGELRSCPGATDLVAGDVVTTGTWTDAWPVNTGESWTAVFSSALPPLRVSFE